MSIELPNGKVCRSLPEQVAENAKNIKLIIEMLDGINIQDNLVVIADISQILTRSELDIVEKPVAFLYYGDQLYIKRNEVGGSAFFDVIFSITGSTVLSFNSKEIEVFLSTGALSLTTSTVSTYSKTELDTQLALKSDITYVDAQLALKANLSGATFTGNIDAPEVGASSKIKDLSKIVDSDGHNRFAEFNLTGYSALTGAGFTITYKKAVLNGKILSIVVVAANETENPINIPTYTTLASVYLTTTPNAWILDKIIPLSGTYVVSQNYANVVKATGSILLTLEKDADNIRIWERKGTALSIPAGDALRIEFNLIIE